MTLLKQDVLFAAIVMILCVRLVDTDCNYNYVKYWYQPMMSLNPNSNS